jgi:hypothetical protein
LKRHKYNVLYLQHGASISLKLACKAVSQQAEPSEKSGILQITEVSQCTDSKTTNHFCGGGSLGIG